MMSEKRIAYPMLVLLATALITSGASADVSRYTDRVTRQVNNVLDGSEEHGFSLGSNDGVPFTGRITGPGETMGITWYDYQHNGSMGRQVAYDPINNYVHFVWRHSPAPVLPDVAYNSYDIDGAVWVHGSGTAGGKVISTDGYTAGYCTIDVTSYGAAAVTHHEGTETAYYATVADIDSNPPLGEFNFVPSAPGPPNCEGWETGHYELTSNYIWPVIDCDVIDGDTILHVVSTEASSEPPPKVKTLVYYRKVNGEWPSCGTAIDSAHAVSAVVRSSQMSDRVAIVWLRPIHYVGDSGDPCGFKDWQQDVVYSESTDGGVHWGPMVNVSDYSQGGTVPITEVEQLAYNDLTALYVGDTLHIVWETPLRDVVNEPCDPLYASRLWHWDSNNQCISIVYDGSRPHYHCYIGAWNNSLAKMNLSECDLKLYVSFTRFGAYTSENGDTNIDCSASGYANGEIYLAASTNAGIIWGEAHNVTNTFTPDCEPGDCLSEHWSSMAKYSTGVLHIQYIEDHDAGGIVFMEGDWTENPVKYLSYPCFTPVTYCEVAVSPIEVGYPTYISPLGQTGCTGDETVTIDLIISNTGTENTSYTILPSDGWIHPEATSSDIPAGCGNIDTIQVTLGPIEEEGIYTGNISVTACGEDELVAQIELRVFCEMWFPEFAVLSTGCWSIGVWNVARTGTGVWYDPEGNMYWFLEEFTFLYDESLVITYADDTAKTWFSINDGSDSDVGFVALDMLSTEIMDSYEYAHCAFGTGDTVVTGEVDYYLPTHPDSCFMIERIEICNHTDTLVRLHVGEAIDWDIPDGQDGSDNRCGYDADRQMLYQFGPPGGYEENLYGGASFCSDIPGAIVLMNDIWIYPNDGYYPEQLGGLLARHSGFELAPADSIEDLNSVYVVDQNLALEPDSCAVYCLVKASSLTGLADLQDLIDKGKRWVREHELGCPGCMVDPCEGVIIGNADGSTPPPPIDIDDVVYLIAYIFTGGPPPTPYAVASGDPTSDCLVDIDDVVQLIVWIFTDGYDPVTCDEWIDACGLLH